MPPSVICCSVCPEIPDAEQRRLEEVGIEQRRLSRPLAAHEPERETAERARTQHEKCRDGLAAFLPDEDPEHDAAHPDDREHCADDVDAPLARVRNVAARA